MANLIFVPKAESDLIEIGFNLFEHMPYAAVIRKLEEITQACPNLAKFPHPGRKRDNDLKAEIRSFAVEPYLIFYRIQSPSEIRILRILHGSRDIGPERF